MKAPFRLQIPLLLFACLALCPVASASAQRPPEDHAQHGTLPGTLHGKQHIPGSAPVLMLSDIHFDPFAEPAKIPELRSAPLDRWPDILSAPAAPTQAADAARLAKACPSRPDTPWPLLRSSLHAAHAHDPHPLFVTVSGDLLTHNFPCKFAATAPGTTASDLSAFSAKTVAFVAGQLRHHFAEAPIYLALGNNDSSCGDYRETPGSAFLADTLPLFGAEASGRHARANALEGTAATGDYSVRLPLPRARLIVLQDNFQSREYAACDAHKDPSAAAAQIAWLRQQLTSARSNGERVWVMAHIPPGADLYATYHAHRDLCGGQSPVMFLHSEALNDTLADFAGTVRFALFAHSHMDEMRFLHAPNGGGVPVKLIPSISPSNGNRPTITLARINLAEATLEDYTVVVATNDTGINANWVPEYNFRDSYHEPDFSPASVARMTAAMQADINGNTNDSLVYQKFLSAGDSGKRALELHLAWPAYSCALGNDHEDDLRRCACPRIAPSPPAPQP